MAKRGDVTRARGVAKRRAVAKDQFASGDMTQQDAVTKGDGDVEAVKADLTQADDVT